MTRGAWKLPALWRRVIRQDRQRLFLCFLLLFLAVRLLVLVSAPYALFDDEELFNGTAARELLRGIHLPLEGYLYWPHEGGALVMVLLTVPLFGLFGTSLAAMKLAPLLVSAGTFAVWLRIAQKYGSRRSFLWVGLLWILAPPLLLKSGLMLWGHHNSVGLPIALATYFLFGVLAATTEAEHRRALLALGVTCGFGMFFAYVFLAALLTVLVVLALHRLQGGRPWVRYWAPAALVGFSPWLLTHLGSSALHEAVFTLRGSGLPAQPGALLQKATTFLFRDLPQSPSFPNELRAAPHLSLLYFFTLAFLVATCFFRWADSLARALASAGPGRIWAQFTSSRCRDLTPFLFCALFGIVYILSPFVVWWEAPELRDYFVVYRYTLPVYPFLFWIAAVHLGRRGTEQRSIRGTTALLFFGLGATSLFMTVNPERLGETFDYRGYSYARYGWRAYQRYQQVSSRDPGRLVRFAAGIDPRFEDEFYRGVSWGVAQFGPPPAPDSADPARAMAEFARVVPEDQRGQLFTGFGWAVADGFRGSIEAIESMGTQVPAPYRADYWGGVGWATARRFHDTPELVLPWIDRLPRDVRPAAYRGLGRLIGENRASGHPFEWSDQSVPDEFRPYVVAGEELAARRYTEGRLLDGPVYMRWGGVTFREYGERAW